MLLYQIPPLPKEDVRNAQVSWWESGVLPLFVYQPRQKQSHLEDSRAFRISKGNYSIWNMIMYDRIPLWLLEENQVYNVDDLK